MPDLRKLGRDKPCILCGSTGTTVLHHVQLPGNHGTGKKPADWPWGIRVCNSCHAYFHGEGRSDHKLMAVAIGKQQIQYATEGILQWP